MWIQVDWCLSTLCYLFLSQFVFISTSLVDVKRQKVSVSIYKCCLFCSFRFLFSPFFDSFIFIFRFQLSGKLIWNISLLRTALNASRTLLLILFYFYRLLLYLSVHLKFAHMKGIRVRVFPSLAITNVTVSSIDTNVERLNTKKKF